MRLLALAIVPLLAAPSVSTRQPAAQRSSATASATPGPSFGISTAPADRDQGVARLAADTETRWVSFDLTPGNQIRFAMQIDGRSITAILDTGVSYTLLADTSPAVVRRALKPGGRASAIGGSVALRWMPTRSIVLGGLTRSGGGVSVAALPALATGSATAVDLLVGRDLLAAHALDIDYAARRFRLIPTGRLPFAGETASLTISSDRRVYESAVRIGTHALAPIVVDTGDGSAITVTAAGWRRAAPPGLPTTTAIAYGLGGSVISGLAIAPEIRVGTLVARDTEVRIEPEAGFSQSIGAAGRLGSGFLQHYRVLLDPSAARMVLRRGDVADPRPIRSTSGLLMGVESNRLKVLHVMRGGPAEASGWQVGDLICSIDGQPIPRDYPTSPLANWTIRPPGSVVRLGLCAGTTRTLTLRTFY
ncbi:PDZ domain-containing protein [Sphingomonas aerolata]|uniref:PDZ domain-containing protein n=1 Tax=Sphingomonas aerolata TaxID=185951 RepID=UPI00141B4FF6|nr:PDZ domain-containing protein [Sphingomonas aerolata]NII57939.1 hypothetical protein [Sphingomonas aerolata]